jgi:hypothetical protein
MSHERQWGVGIIPIDPRGDDVIALFHVIYATSSRNHDPGCFMAQQRREAMTRPSRPPHRVNLCMTNAARKELGQNPVGRRIRKLNFIDD